IVLVLILIVALGAGAAYWKQQQKAERDAETAKAKNMQMTSAVPAHTFSDPPPRPEAKVVPAVATSTTSAPALPGNTGDNVKPRFVPTLDKSGSSLMATSTETAVQPDASIKPYGKTEPEPGALTGMLTATQTQTRSAGHLGNRNFMLAKGSFIDCALQTKLVSTVPGMTACVVTRNIYSDNGKVLLIERGSTISGEYKSNIRQGQRRIYVLWSRIKTPNGVIINLDSPGTDALGAAGVPGWVENHFWERFGAALMLSLVDDIARFASYQGSGSGSDRNTINFSNTGVATQNMAAEALKGTINIPPTLYKNQGEQVGVYIARDLDFSSVYDVAATN
ncbi:MAG: type IV secretion system protein VirB10, partial [Methylomicrobium sp.]|nr:type IV secretion system protein VirB10 [Methylomicrobium sp.]